MEGNKVDVKRLKSVTVETPSGEKKVTMVPVIIDLQEDRLGIPESFCGSCCSYAPICGKLRDPRDPNNKNRTLADWCNDISFEDSNLETPNDISTMYPMEGEIEKLFDKDSEPFKQLIELNPLINLNTFIDTVCPGFCDKYNKDHSNCSLDNTFCICRGLFVRKMDTTYLTDDKKDKDDK